MGNWFGEVQREYYFICPDEHTKTIRASSLEYNTLRDNDQHCDCGKLLEYTGFGNLEANDGGINQRPAVESVEKNGRVGVKIGSTYMSKTKWNYMNTGKIENVYTPAFEKHLAKSKEKKEALDRKNLYSNIKK